MKVSIASLHAAGSSFIKNKAAQLVLEPHYGAIGDRHAGRDPTKALLITPVEIYDGLTTQGLKLAYGSLGENIVLHGIRRLDLPVGSHLRIAETLLEISAPCTVCSRLSEIDLRLPKLLYSKRGAYARILAGGVICQGEQVIISLPAKEGAVGGQ